MISKSLEDTVSTAEKKRSVNEKFAGDDPLATKAAYAQCSVVSIYEANIAGETRSVTVVWSKNLINHSLSVAVERAAWSGGEGPAAMCKIELKPWPFWSKKGLKSLEVEGRRVDVFWDFRSAKFSSSPEPTSSYYVAIVCCEEVVLLLGDCKKEAYKRTKCRPSLADAVLVSKRENVFGKKCFSSRAKFDERKDHDVIIENSISGPSDPEMWITIDGAILVHVSNLQWKFRGNETVVVDGTAVQVFWDVHDWLFASPGTGHALFIFKPAGPNGSSATAAKGDDSNNKQQELSAENSRKPPASNCSLVSEFSFFLYARRLE